VDNQKTDGGTAYQQILINAKLQIGKRGQNTELTGRSLVWRRKPLLDCSAIYEEEEEFFVLLFQVRRRV
jgi:hypothetical protein